MLALLLTAVMGAQAPALPDGSQHPVYEEAVEIQAPSLTAIRRRVVVRGPDAALFSDVEPSWLSARLGGDAAATPVTLRARRFEGPAAITVLIDTTANMSADTVSAQRLVAEILLAAPSGDHVRLISYNRRFTSTAWLGADAMRAAAVRRHLRHLASLKPARRPACLADEPGVALDTDEALWSWAGDCPLEQQRLIERRAVEAVAASITDRGIAPD